MSPSEKVRSISTRDNCRGGAASTLGSPFGAERTVWPILSSTVVQPTRCGRPVALGICDPARKWAPSFTDPSRILVFPRPFISRYVVVTASP
ncbi:hypothetical protein GCM10010443_64660 [Actinoplanes cyaneus]